jgi:hypothetical protein
MIKFARQALNADLVSARDHLSQKVTVTGSFLFVVSMMEGMVFYAC